MTTGASPATMSAAGPLVPGDAVLVLFGATGDLARRKLLPGLFHLAVAGLMPRRYRIIGSAPPGRATGAAGFADLVRQALQDFGRKEVTGKAWEAFGGALSFAPSTDNDLTALAEAVSSAEADLGTAQRMIYLAVPPAAFIPMIRALGASRLVTRQTKLVIEKPFGSSLDSARQLNSALHEVFTESQIFRIDHFLGKEGVQNILALRFANGLFEPAWDARHLEYVQIDVPEQLTIEGRGAFYEPTGAFRDMVVTHLFQLLGFLAMEAPDALDAASLHREKLRTFEAMRPLDPARVIYGQYDGYRSEPGVAAGSHTETFVAAEAAIGNRRWDGVPFYLRTGKALAQTRSTVTLGFKKPALQLFGLSRRETARLRPNELVFDLADPGSVTVDFSTKKPGPRMALEPASCSFRYADSFTVASELEAYERLLHDVMLGDPTLFNDAAGIERLWEVAAPLLEAPPAPVPYAQGSWGPKHAAELPAPHRWHLPDHPVRDQGARR
ncbi:MAG: glucose-6-phosphate dehydrogenase [Streptosporangiaceae bacterium]